jgi:hypothetical protein
VVGIATVRLDGVDSGRSGSSIRYVTLEDRIPGLECVDLAVKSQVTFPKLPYTRSFRYEYRKLMLEDIVYLSTITF